MATSTEIGFNWTCCSLDIRPGAAFLVSNPLFGEGAFPPAAAILPRMIRLGARGVNKSDQSVIAGEHRRGIS
jgi:hypothetical protein